MTLGEKITDLRKKRGLSQEELAIHWAYRGKRSASGN